MADLIEKIVPFELQYSWGRKEPEDTYEDMELNVKYDPQTGEIVEILDSFDTDGIYDVDSSCIIDNLLSFFTKHLGVSEEGIIYNYRADGEFDCEPARFYVHKDFLNKAINSYYTEEQPETKFFKVDNSKLNVTWDGYFHY